MKLFLAPILHLPRKKQENLACSFACLSYTVARKKIGETDFIPPIENRSEQISCENLANSAVLYLYAEPDALVEANDNEEGPSPSNRNLPAIGAMVRAGSRTRNHETTIVTAGIVSVLLLRFPFKHLQASRLTQP
jgi:hypothetical protein